MSAATEFPPVVRIPERARHADLRAATVLPFRPRLDEVFDDDIELPQVVGLASPRIERRPVRMPVATPRTVPALRSAPDLAPQALRITRRGYAVLAVLVAVAAAGLLWLAHASWPAAAGPATTSSSVTVHVGDTLWTIASRVAPQRDPRTVVADLERLNGLADSAITPGQVLRVR